MSADRSNLAKLNDGVRRFKFNPAGYCGVVMPECVMKKLAKLAERHERAVREILREHADELYPYHWSCASEYNDAGKIGRQVMVDFVIKGERGCVESAINLFRTNQPEYMADVWVLDSYKDGKPLAEKLLGEGSKSNA